MEVLDFVRELDSGVRKLPVERKVKSAVRNFRLNVEIAEQVCSSWSPAQVESRLSGLRESYSKLAAENGEGRLDPHAVLPLVVLLLRLMADVEVIE